MPAPSSSLATLRPDLASSFMEFDLAADRQGFIAASALPVVEVDSQAGNFGKIPVEQLLKVRETKRAPRAGYSRSNYTFAPATYTCDEHGAEEPVDDREARMYANYFNAEVLAALRARDAVMRKMEIDAAAALFNTAVWNGAALTTAVTNGWNNVANATPQADVEAAAQLVFDGTGLWPNALVINRKVFRNIRKTTDFKNAVASAGAGDSSLAGRITAAQMAQYFDLDYILVAGGAYDAAKEGQSVSISPLWSGTYAMVCRVATGPDPSEPCVGRIFHWGQDGSTITGTMETYRDESVRGDVVRCRNDRHLIILYTELAHLLSNITV